MQSDANVIEVIQIIRSSFRDKPSSEYSQWNVFLFGSVISELSVSFTPSRPFLHTQDMYFVFVQLLSSGSAWFAIIIIVITCLFPDVVKKVFYRHLQPTNTQKSQVMQEGQAGSQAEAFLCPKCVSLIFLPESKIELICYFPVID